MNRAEQLLKRTTDLVIAAGAITSLAPLLGAIAVAIRLDSPGPVFFRQERLGRGGKIFRIWKFRTMHAGADVRIDDRGQVVNRPDDARHSRVGRFLRSTSLDELPQLFNVFQGDMSLIGPRPDLPEALRYYSERQRRKLEVRPGITGLAQVRGRNSLAPDAKWDLDAEYSATASLSGDLRILGQTLLKVVAREGIYDKGRDDGQNRSTR